MNHSHPTVIQDFGIFIASLGAVISVGAVAWKTHFSHHRNMREAEALIDQISRMISTLSEEDKQAIDAYIAQVSAMNQPDTHCLIDTQQMLEKLALAQSQRTRVSAQLAAHPLFKFPWSNLARSIETLLEQCRMLHKAVKDSTSRAREHRQQAPSSSASASSSSFIQQPPSSYTRSISSGPPYTHSGASGFTSFSGHSGGTHHYGYPPNPSSAVLPSGSRSSDPCAGPSQPIYPPWGGQVSTSSNAVSSTTYYPPSTLSHGTPGSTGSLQTDQSAQYYGSQYSTPSGTSGYATAPSTYYTTAGTSTSLPQSGSASSSVQGSTNASSGRR